MSEVDIGVNPPIYMAEGMNCCQPSGVKIVKMTLYVRYVEHRYVEGISTLGILFPI